MNEPNFSLDSSKVPEWPLIYCSDGFAWHPRPIRRPCFQGFTSAPAELVAKVLSGTPIENAWALRLLLTGAPGDPLSHGYPGIRTTLFPSDCVGCGKSHRVTRSQWVRMAMAIHPGALESLREVQPPLRLLRTLDLPGDRKYEKLSPKERRSRLEKFSGLPVRETPEKTLIAQISWACELQARREG